MRRGELPPLTRVVRDRRLRAALPYEANWTADLTMLPQPHDALAKAMSPGSDEHKTAEEVRPRRQETKEKKLCKTYFSIH